WHYQVTENLLKERGYGTDTGSSTRPTSSAEAADDYQLAETTRQPTKPPILKVEETRTISRSTQLSFAFDKSTAASTHTSMTPIDPERSLHEYQIPASILDKGKSIELNVMRMDSDDKRQSQASSGSGSLPSWTYEYYSHPGNYQQQLFNNKDPSDPDIILPEASTSAAAGGSGSPNGNNNNNNSKSSKDGSSNRSSSTQQKSSQSPKSKRKARKGKLTRQDSAWRETRKNYFVNPNLHPKTRLRTPPEQFVVCPYGSVLFMLGFLLPPLWWFGSFFPRHSSGMTDRRWKRYNRLMSVLSLLLIAGILELTIWYLNYNK
ncbi:6052_t:CDS:1, partial [Acaulospora colombiana]